MLRGPSSFTGMPDFVARLEDGDWTSLALQAAQMRLGLPLRLMGLAMDCASGAGDDRLRLIRTQAASNVPGLLQNA
jgi:hypothetical protein